ncbi:MAG: phosphatidate cytidylyltransferase [SAR324 cluster bacterium]|nr:phosphatidate cytidylyltransferase [SAR324 cluster bacterium]
MVSTPHDAVPAMTMKQPDTPQPVSVSGKSDPAKSSGDAVPPKVDGGGMAPGWGGNLKLRTLSAVPALVVVLAVIGLVPTWAVGVIVLAVGSYGMYEFHDLFSDVANRPIRREWAITAAAVVGLGALVWGLPGLSLSLFASVVGLAAIFWFADTEESVGGVAPVGTAVFGLILIPWSVSHLGLIHGLTGGPGMLALLVVVVSLNDSLAYLVGSLFGSRLLLPRVSPKKTVEGALAGLAGGVAGGLLVWIWLLGFAQSPGLWESLVLAMALAVIAQMGDLMESKLKRIAGVRESGRLLPGHGGLLDRIDGYLLAGPVLYYYLLVSAPGA